MGLFDIFKPKIYGIKIYHEDNEEWLSVNGVVLEFQSIRAACETLGNYKYKLQDYNLLSVEEFDA